MKITQQCNFNRDGEGLQCPHDATCKWGDNWFCDYHGSRPKSAPLNPDSNAVIDREKLFVFVQSLCTSISKRVNNGEIIDGAVCAHEFMDKFWLFGGIEPTFEDTQRLNMVEWLFRNFPHVQIYVNEDPHQEDDDGALLPVGTTISLTGCHGTSFVTAPNIREALDKISSEPHP